MKRLLLISLLVVSQAWAGQPYYSQVSIKASQITGTLTDYPMLVYQTDARFKTIANSGHVANPNGYDIRPYSDTGLTSALTYQLKRYNATTGEVEMRIKISSFSTSSVIYLAYGDSSITTDGSSTSTWDSNYLAEYALPDGTTLSVTSGTGSNNGTANNCTAASGQIDGCVSWAGANNQNIGCGNGMNPTAMTISAWVKGTSFLTYATVAGRVVSGSQFVLYVKSTGKLACYASATGSVSYDGTGSHTLSTGTWYHLAMTYDSSAGLVGYVNGASDGTGAANGNLSTTTAVFNIAKDEVTTSRYWQGSIDEVEVSNVARSAAWIAVGYNEGFPATFETLGAEVGTGSNLVGTFFNSD